MINENYLYIAVYNHVGAVYSNTRVNSSEVLVLNLNNFSVVDTIPINNEITNMALSPNGKSIYVLSIDITNSSRDLYNYSVSVLNTSNNKSKGEFPLANAKLLSNLLFFSKDGKYAYVSGYVVNTATEAIGDYLPGFSKYCNSSDGKSIYFTSPLDYNASPIEILNTSDNEVTGYLPVNNQQNFSVKDSPIASPDNKYLYVPVWGLNETIIINLATGAIARAVHMASPISPVLSADGRYVYLQGIPLDSPNHSIVLNATTNQAVTQFSIPLSPEASAPFGLQGARYYYSFDWGNNELYAYDFSVPHIYLLVEINYGAAVILLLLAVLALNAWRTEGRKYKGA